MKLKVKDLSVSFQNKSIIKDINIEIKDGEFIGILGPSGCGKSTILNALTNNINKDFQDFNDNIRNKIDISDKKIASFDQEVNSLLESNDIDALKKINK